MKNIYYNILIKLDEESEVKVLRENIHEHFADAIVASEQLDFNNKNKTKKANIYKVKSDN